jgi:hypothetical protein
MLLRNLILNRYLEAIHARPELQLVLEDAGVALMNAARTAKADRDKLEKFDFEQLADVITAIKLLTNSDNRQAMTRGDIGIDPNNSEELLKMLDTIPSDPSRALPGATKEIIKAIALMSKSTRAKELEALKKLVGPKSPEREKAVEALQMLANQVIKAIDKLKTKVQH